MKNWSPSCRLFVFNEPGGTTLFRSGVISQEYSTSKPPFSPLLPIVRVKFILDDGVYWFVQPPAQTPSKNDGVPGGFFAVPAGSDAALSPSAAYPEADSARIMITAENNFRTMPVLPFAQEIEHRQFPSG
jgi:hypothetical protein